MIASANRLMPDNNRITGPNTLHTAVSTPQLMLPQDVRYAIIQPTLAYLGIDNRQTENLLLGTLLTMSRLTAERKVANAIGPYAICANLHTSIWDDYLAREPDRASLVRGLASQRSFLQNPHAELDFNLAYATAIAWMVYERNAICLNTCRGSKALARIWRQLYPHRGGRSADFLASWAQFNAPRALISA